MATPRHQTIRTHMTHHQVTKRHQRITHLPHQRPFLPRKHKRSGQNCHCSRLQNPTLFPRLLPSLPPLPKKPNTASSSSPLSLSSSSSSTDSSQPSRSVESTNTKIFGIPKEKEAAQRLGNKQISGRPSPPHTKSLPDTSISIGISVSIGLISIEFTPISPSISPSPTIRFETTIQSEPPSIETSHQEASLHATDQSSPSSNEEEPPPIHTTEDSEHTNYVIDRVIEPIYQQHYRILNRQTILYI